MKVTHFVTGHLDITPEQFREHYVPLLEQACKEADSEFVMGTAPGADHMTLEWLLANGVAPGRITVCVLERFRDTELPAGVKRIGHFPSHEKCDAAMAAMSHYCIAWVRPEEETRRIVEAKITAGEIPGPYRPRESATERNMRRPRAFTPAYWHDGKLLSIAECRICRSGRERYGTELFPDKAEQPCYTVHHRRGPGDITQMKVCEGHFASNFGSLD
jgi:hypothetical protein